MTTPSVPPNAGRIMAAVRRALRGVDVRQTEAMRILSWAHEETPAVYDGDQTTYLVLGSYREPYIRRLRAVSDRLNRRYGTYAFLIGDLADIDITRLPEFRVKFHLTAAFADYVAGVFEQDAGGEINELGKVAETEYFEKAYALPRAYRWETESNLDDERDVFAAAAQIADAAFHQLDAPVKRVAGAFSSIPYADVLERAVLPQDDDVLAAAREVLAY